MNHEEFICFFPEGSQTRTYAKDLCQKIEELKPATEDLADPSFISSLFLSKTGHLCRTQFVLKKKVVCQYYAVLCKENVVSRGVYDYTCSVQIEDVVQSLLSVYYFRSLEDVISYIDLVASLYKKDDKAAPVLNIKSAVILAWYGLSVQEMISVKKSDLDSEHSLVRVGTEREVFVDHYFEILKAYSEEQCCSGVTNKRMNYYADSEYLFRTHANPHMSQAGFINLIFKFNAHGSILGKTISIPDIRRNGLFERTDRSEDKTGTLEAEIMNDVNLKIKYENADIYRKWKSVYVGEEKGAL